MLMNLVGVHNIEHLEAAHEVSYTFQ